MEYGEEFENEASGNFGVKIMTYKITRYTIRTIIF